MSSKRNKRLKYDSFLDAFKKKHNLKPLSPDPRTNRDMKTGNSARRKPKGQR